MQAFADGVLLKSEIPSDMLARQSETEALSAKRFLQRQREHQAHSLKRRVHSHGPTDVFNAKVFVHPSIPNPDLGTKVRLTRKAELAKVFVVQDVTKPGEKISWCATLGGGVVCTPEYIRSGMKRGTALAYSPAVARIYWSVSQRGLLRIILP